MEASQIESPTQSTEATAPIGQVPSQAQETPNPSGQAPLETKAPAEDAFSDIDPNTLSPENQASYKRMQADYTRKTQSIAEAKKKAAEFDKLSKDETINAYLKGLNRAQRAELKDQKQEMERKLGEKISDEEFVDAFNSGKDGFLKFMSRIIKEETGKSQKEIEELKQYKNVNEVSHIVETFATAMDKENKPIRPDFYALDEDSLITGYLRVNPPEGQTPDAITARLNEGYTWAKSVATKYYEKGKAEALQTIQKKVSTSTNPPTPISKGSYSGPDPKGVGPREALELARRGIRIPQVYD